jgi:hypothetical protein
MDFQNRGNYNVDNFKTPNLGVLGRKWHLDVTPMANHIKYYKGEGGGFPQI